MPIKRRAINPVGLLQRWPPKDTYLLLLLLLTPEPPPSRRCNSSAEPIPEGRLMRSGGWRPEFAGRTCCITTATRAGRPVEFTERAIVPPFKGTGGHSRRLGEGSARARRLRQSRQDEPQQTIAGRQS